MPPSDATLGTTPVSVCDDKMARMPALVCASSSRLVRSAPKKQSHSPTTQPPQPCAQWRLMLGKIRSYWGA